MRFELALISKHGTDLASQKYASINTYSSEQAHRMVSLSAELRERLTVTDLVDGCRWFLHRHYSYLSCYFPYIPNAPAC